MSRISKVKLQLQAALMCLPFIVALAPKAYAAADYLVPSGETLTRSSATNQLISVRLGRVESLVFSHDRRTLAAVTQGNSVCFWELASGRPSRCQRLPESSRITALAWSPGDLWLAVGDSDGRVELLARGKADGKPRCTLPPLSAKQTLGRAISSMVFLSQDGTLLAMGSHNESLRSCPRAVEPGSRSGETPPVASVTWPALSGLSGLIELAALSHDGSSVAIAAGNTIGVWDLKSGQPHWTKQDLPSLPVSLALSPDGQVLASGLLSGAVRLWRPRTGTESELRGKSGNGRLGAARILVFSGDGRMLVAGSDDRSLARWQVDKGSHLTSQAAADSELSALAVSHDGVLIATAAIDGQIQILDALSGVTLRTLRGNVEAVRTMAISPAGTLLAAASEDRRLRLWRRPEVGATAQPGWELFCDVDLERTLASRVQALAFAPPDGRVLALLLEGRRTALLDVTSCPAKLLPALADANDWQKALAFSSDGTRLALGADDGSIRVWDVVEKRLRATLLGHRDEVRALAFSPTDSGLLVSGSLDKTVRLWRVAGGKELAASPEQTEGVRALAFSTDGQQLASSAGKEVALWQVDAAGMLLPVSQKADSKIVHEVPVLRVDFRGNTQLLTTLSDGRVRLHELASKQLIKEVRLAAAPQGDAAPLPAQRLQASAWNASSGSLAVADGGWVALYQLSGASSETIVQNIVRLLAAGEAHAILLPNGQLFRHDHGELLWTAQGADGIAALPPPVPPVPANLSLRVLPAASSPGFGQPEVVRIEVRNAATAGPAYWLRLDGIPPPGESILDVPWAQLPAAPQLRLDPGTAAVFDLYFVLRPSAGRLGLPPRSLRLCLRLRHALEPQQSQLCEDARDLLSLQLEIPVGPWWWRHIDKLGPLALLFLLLLTWQLSWSRVARRLRRHPVVRAVRQGKNALAGLRLPELAEAEQILRQAEATFALRHVRRRALRLTELSEPAWRRAQGALASPASLVQALADCVQAQLGATTEPLFQNEELCAYGLELPALSLHLPSRCTLIMCHPQKSQLAARDTQLPVGSQSAEEVLLRCPREQLQGIHFALVIDLSFQTELARFAQGRMALKKLCPGVPFIFLDEAALRRILFASQVPVAQVALREPIVAQCEPHTIVSYQEGGGIPPDDEGLFFGRQAELERMLGRQRQNFLLVGPRKMGKSSLLNALARELARRFPEAQVLRYEPLFGRLQGIESIDAALTAETPEQFYESVLRRSEAHQIFLLDETDDFIAEESRSQFRYCKVMRALSGQGRASFVLAGYQELLEATQNGDHPLFNFGAVLRLEPLDREAARRMIVEPISALGMRFAEPQRTVDWLRDQTACRPHLLALLCAALVKLRPPLSTSPITQSEVQSTCQQRELLQNAFGSWNGEAVGVFDRVVLRAVLLLDRPQPTDVRDTLSQRGVALTEEGIKASLSRLYSRHYALIVDGSGRLLCPVPLFRYFVTEPSPSRDDNPAPAAGESSLRAQLDADIRALQTAVR